MKTDEPGRCGRRGALALAVGGALMLAAGCTGESLRVAAESQRRADAVQDAVVSQQNLALRGLLFRDMTSRLRASGIDLDDGQEATMNAVWNDRDLLEFWIVQHERARALRLVGVDAHLYAGQSIVDLLWKRLAGQIDRARGGLMRAAAASAAPSPDDPPPSTAPASDPGGP